MLKAISLLFIAACTSACSNEQLYNTIQVNSLSECDRYNNHTIAKQSCIERTKMSYDEYKKEAGIESEK